MDQKSEELGTEVQAKIDALCKFSEDDFTKRILRPLFQAMGYPRVDFNGGPLERGRDLIAQKENPPSPKPYVAYVQAKKVNNPNKISSAAKLEKLLLQLRQCLDREVSDLDGNWHRADVVFLACPQQISDRLFEEIRTSLGSGEQKVTLLDGPKVLKYIESFAPHLNDVFMSVEDKISGTTSFDPGNYELLQAIKHNEIKDIGSFYNDLSFFVGSVDSNLLMHLDVKLKCEYLSIPKVDWPKVARDLSQIHDLHGVWLLKESLVQVQESYEYELDKYNSKDNQSLISDIDRLSREKEATADRIEEIVVNLRSRFEKDKSTVRLSAEEIETISESIKLAARHDLKHEKKIHDNYKEDFSKIINLQKNLLDIGRQLDGVRKLVLPVPKYLVNVDFEQVKAEIRNRIESYFNGIALINSTRVSKIKLREFLYETEKTLSLIGDLLHNETVNLFLDYTIEKSDQDRVSVSAHDIFETGHDIAVYGSAGVGKTTTLEVYAKKSESCGKRIVYVPLNRTVDKLSKIRLREIEEGHTVGRDVFLKNLLIKSILISRRIEPTPEKIESAKSFFSKNPVIVLDGLDEAYSAIPEIIDSIRNHKFEYPETQMIISSRDCVSYLGDIDFLGITLLPFTEQQLYQFIRGWFDEDHDSSVRLIGQIEKGGISDAVKTPLVATIACSLVEKGIKAPSSEHELYTERFRLLTGDYDQYKNIERQKNTSRSLSICARTAALAMHDMRVRSLSWSELFNVVKRKLVGKYEDKWIESCLRELRDPCNVLHYDPISDEYSFGHFRFQEHLVAQAMRYDREINLAEITTMDWWRGALCLYAQEGNVFTLVESIYRHNSSIKSSIITLRAMAENLPISEREDFLRLIEMYAGQDDLELSTLPDIDHEDVGISADAWALRN